MSTIIRKGRQPPAKPDQPSQLFVERSVAPPPVVTGYVYAMILS